MRAATRSTWCSPATTNGSECNPPSAGAGRAAGRGPAGGAEGSTRRRGAGDRIDEAAGWEAQALEPAGVSGRGDVLGDLVSTLPGRVSGAGGGAPEIP